MTRRRDTEIFHLSRILKNTLKTKFFLMYPDAFLDRSKDKIGYEIPFTRYFYKYVPPRNSDEIKKEIIDNENRAGIKRRCYNENER